MKKYNKFIKILKTNILIGFFVCFLLCIFYANINNMQMTIIFIFNFGILGVWHGIFK